MPPHICEGKTSGRLLATVNTTCPAGSTEFRGAGINLFDLFWCGSTGMGVSAACTFNESASMLASYKRTGLRFFRFFATDWGPNAAFAIQHPHQNWAELDRVCRRASAQRDGAGPRRVGALDAVGVGVLHAPRRHGVPVAE